MGPLWMNAELWTTGIPPATDSSLRLRAWVSGTQTRCRRRFKDVLSRWPDELERYYQFSGERQRGRARARLAEAGYRPAGSVKS